MLSSRLSKKIVTFLIESNIITAKEQDAYLFCFMYIIDMLLYISISLFVGFFVHHVFYTFLLLCIIIPFRMFAGGIHAPNATICYFLSYGLTIFMIVFLPIIANKLKGFAFPLLLIECFCIFLFAPVESPNKPLSPTHKQDLKRKSRFFVSFYIMSYFLFFLFHQHQYCNYLPFCGIIPTVSVLLGTFTNGGKHDVAKNRNLR